MQQCPDDLFFYEEVGDCWYQCVEDRDGLCTPQNTDACDPWTGECYSLKWAEEDCAYFSYCYRNDDFWPEEYRVCTEKCPLVPAAEGEEEEDDEQWVFSESEARCVQPDPSENCPQNAVVLLPFLVQGEDIWQEKFLER